MTVPQTGLPTLCYTHPSVLRDMASIHRPSQKIAAGRRLDNREQMLEDIKLRIAEVRRPLDLMSVGDKEIEQMVDKVKDMRKL